MHPECSLSALSVARGFAVDLTAYLAVYACSASGLLLFFFVALSF